MEFLDYFDPLDDAECVPPIDEDPHQVTIFCEFCNQEKWVPIEHWDDIEEFGEDRICVDCMPEPQI